jgi:hypothetical protein
MKLIYPQYQPYFLDVAPYKEKYKGFISEVKLKIDLNILELTAIAKVYDGDRVH